MPTNQSFFSHTCSSEEDNTSGIIERYKDHRNKILIKSKKCYLANTFSFVSVSF